MATKLTYRIVHVICTRFSIEAASDGTRASSFIHSGPLFSSCREGSSITALDFSSKRRYFRLLFLTALLFFLLFDSPTIAALLPSPFSSNSSFSANICLAIFRFCERDLVACTLRTRPVGMCFSCTADEVLFCLTSCK